MIFVQCRSKDLEVWDIHLQMEKKIEINIKMVFGPIKCSINIIKSYHLVFFSFKMCNNVACVYISHDILEHKSKILPMGLVCSCRNPLMYLHFNLQIVDFQPVPFFGFVCLSGLIPGFDFLTFICVFGLIKITLVPALSFNVCIWVLHRLHLGLLYSSDSLSL